MAYKIIFTAKEFKERLLDCIYNYPTGYNNTVDKARGIYYNCGYNYGKGYTFDCWNWLKALWWGWTSGFSKGSFLFAPNKNNIGDWNGRQILDKCSGVSTDFSKVGQCEFLLTQAEDHAGIYIGEHQWGGYTFNTAECTPKTNIMTGGCCLTYTDEKGRRFNHKGGIQAGAWKYHGYLPWIDYTNKESNIDVKISDIVNGKAVVTISGTVTADVNA